MSYGERHHPPLLLPTSFQEHKVKVILSPFPPEHLAQGFKLFLASSPVHIFVLSPLLFSELWGQHPFLLLFACSVVSRWTVTEHASCLQRTRPSNESPSLLQGPLSINGFWKQILSDFRESKALDLHIIIKWPTRQGNVCLCSISARPLPLLPKGRSLAPWFSHVHCESFLLVSILSPPLGPAGEASS